MSIPVGNHLKVWRAKSNLTQSELAEKIGVSRKTINTLERGVYTPSIGLTLRISAFFAVNVEQIFYLE